MAISYSFVDNGIYGTDDINGITKDLTGAGVAPFLKKDTYSTSDLNSITAAMVEVGVSLDGCKCTISDSTVTVGEGIVYFENGVRMTVDEDGYEVSVPALTKGYICARFSEALQRADIVFSENESESGQLTVLLAEVSSDKMLTDVRKFARSKVASFGSNATFETAFTYPDNPVYDEGKGMYEFGYVEGVDLSKFNYALISYNMTSGYNVTKCYGTFNLMSNRFEGVIMGDRYTGYNQTKLLDWSNGVVYYVEKVDNRLVLYMKGETKYASEIPFKVVLV